MCTVNHRLSERRRRGVVRRGDALVRGTGHARALEQCRSVSEQQGGRARTMVPDPSLQVAVAMDDVVVHSDRCVMHAQTAVTSEGCRL